MGTISGLAGKFLIAAPDLRDENFTRTVILMIQHSLEGAMGVVINHPSEISIDYLWNQVSDVPCTCTEPVRIGGPVQGPLIAIHQCEELAEQTVLTDVYVSMGQEFIDKLVRQTDHSFRLFSGYSGWSPGQLEAEIEQGGWLTLDATPQFVFAEDDTMWKYVCESVGNDVLKSQLGSLGMSDPGLN